MYAQQSAKWHYTMARYLGVSPDTSFLFGILPGVCREAIGRYDHMYTNFKCFNSDKTYAWSEHHYNKINNGRFSHQTAYYGTAPFLWELGRVAAQGKFVLLTKRRSSYNKRVLPPFSTGTNRCCSSTTIRFDPVEIV